MYSIMADDTGECEIHCCRKENGRNCQSDNIAISSQRIHFVVLSAGDSHQEGGRKENVKMHHHSSKVAYTFHGQTEEHASCETPCVVWTY